MWFFLAFCGFAACVAGFAGVGLLPLVALGLLAPWAASQPVLAVFGVTRRWHRPLLLVVGFVLVRRWSGSGCTAGQSGTRSRGGASSRGHDPGALTFAAQRAPSVVTAVLDLTTINQFYGPKPCRILHFPFSWATTMDSSSSRPSCSTGCAGRRRPVSRASSLWVPVPFLGCTRPRAGGGCRASRRPCRRLGRACGRVRPRPACRCREVPCPAACCCPDSFIGPAPGVRGGHSRPDLSSTRQGRSATPVAERGRGVLGLPTPLPGSPCGSRPRTR